MHIFFYHLSEINYKEKRASSWSLSRIETHIRNLIHIAFPRQKWLGERASVLR
jgi:hypothetical protein